MDVMAGAVHRAMARISGEAGEFLVRLLLPGDYQAVVDTGSGVLPIYGRTTSDGLRIVALPVMQP